MKAERKREKNESRNKKIYLFRNKFLQKKEKRRGGRE